MQLGTQELAFSSTGPVPNFVPDALVRLSVGLETLDDILWDLDQALERAA